MAPSVWMICIAIGLARGSNAQGSKNDVVVILHTPSTLSRAELNETLNFIYSIVDRLTIGENDTLVSILTYCETVSEQFALNGYTTKSELSREIFELIDISLTENVQPKTEEALVYATSHSYTTAKGSRTDADRWAVLVVSEESLSYIQTFFAANNLKSAGVTIIVVGIGPLLAADTRELTLIASEDSGTSEDLYFYYSSYIYSCNAVLDIVTRIDNTSSIPSVTNCPDPDATTTQTVVSYTSDVVAVDVTNNTPVIAVGAIGALVLLIFIVFIVARIIYLSVKSEVCDLTVEDAIKFYGDVPLGETKSSFQPRRLKKKDSFQNMNNNNYKLKLFILKSYKNGIYCSTV